MKIIKGSYNEISNQEPLTITIGNFDGIHHGHQKLINQTKQYSDTKSAVMTFDPHPKNFYHHNHQHLMNTPAKTFKFQALEIDFLFIIDFSESFAKLIIADFINFLKTINVKRIIIGKDFSFAFQGQGKPNDLKKHFEVVIIEEVKEENQVISTTLIKSLLDIPDLLEIERILGSKYIISGIVKHGNKIGRTLGFPTANLDTANYYLPKSGTYEVKVSIDGLSYQGLANIGHNPTINQTDTIRVEVYVVDFNQTIYGQTVTLEFIKYLREEIKFPSKEDLIKQMKKDLEELT